MGNKKRSNHKRAHDIFKLLFKEYPADLIACISHTLQGKDKKQKVAVLRLVESLTANFTAVILASQSSKYTTKEKFTSDASLCLFDLLEPVMQVVEKDR